MSGTQAYIPTLDQNRESNFYFSFLILPKPKREAIETIYAFCRTTDDIVDQVGDEVEKYARLLTWTDELKRSLYGVSSYSLLNKLATIIIRFNIPVEHFYDLIKGMEMDLTNKRYETFVESNRTATVQPPRSDLSAPKYSGIRTTKRVSMPSTWESRCS